MAKFGHCIILDDVETDPKVTEIDRKLTKFYKRGSTFCDALKVDSDVMGIIALWRTKRWKFSQEELNILRTFVNQISLVLHTRMLFENNREKIRELLVLQKAVSELSSNYILDRMHQVLISNALKISGANKALIYFVDLEKESCFINDGKKVYINEKSEYDEKITRSIIKKAIDTDTIVVRRPSPDSAGGSITDLFDGYPSGIAFPIKIKDKFKGALYLGKRAGDYSRDQINVLDILVKNAAISYDNAIMHSKLSLEARSLKTEVRKLKERENVLLGFKDILGKSKRCYVSSM